MASGPTGDRSPTLEDIAASLAALEVDAHRDSHDELAALVEN